MSRRDASDAEAKYRKYCRAFRTSLYMLMLFGSVLMAWTIVASIQASRFTLPAFPSVVFGITAVEALLTYFAKISALNQLANNSDSSTSPPH